VSMISWSIKFRLAIFLSMSSSLLTLTRIGVIDNGYFSLTGKFTGGVPSFLGGN
jgi:hypothetical protein